MNGYTQVVRTNGRMRTEPFTLDRWFLAQFEDEQPDWGPIGYPIFKTFYARPIDDGTEEFWQTIERVVTGTYRAQQQHQENMGLSWDPAKAQASAQEMFWLMWEFKFLPPGRGLWMMGTEYIGQAGSAALNNCAFVSTDEIDQDFARPFCFLMDMSMLGVGVGADTKGVDKVVIQQPIVSDEVYVVDDSREGWVDLVRTVLNSYVGVGEFPFGIDVSQIREEGTPIKGFGGTASGPGPLLELVESLGRVLDDAIGSPISSTTIVDLFNYIGKCVVAGNVRRSAEIMFGEPEDEEFLDLKDPTLHREELDDRRWASNNSILAKVGMDYSEVAKRTATNGEPGYFWMTNAQHYGRMGEPPDMKDMDVRGANPCGEQLLEPNELCCLVEVFPSRHDTYEEFERTLKFAYLYAKTVTLIPTHDPQTNAVMMKNRRIGTSLSGIVQAFNKFGKRRFLQWCKTGWQYIQDLDKVYSNWMCVPLSKRTTTVKPGGTTPLLPGVNSGIHHAHGKHYIQRVRFSKTNPIIDAARAAGYHVEDDVVNDRMVVIDFPIKEENFDRGKKDVSMWEQLENVAQMQHYWSDNSISCTVSYKPEEAKDIKQALELYEVRLKSISFLPADPRSPTELIDAIVSLFGIKDKQMAAVLGVKAAGFLSQLFMDMPPEFNSAMGHGYKQPPLEQISGETYEELVAELSPLKIGDVEHDYTKKFCEGDNCDIEVA